MKIISDYTIYCTESQTMKALGIGAPIDETAVMPPTMFIGEKIYSIPTAEQMIGWIEAQGYQFNVHTNMFNEWEVLVYTENTDNVICEIADSDWNKTKKEATLAAIDAALEYLENLKQ